MESPLPPPKSAIILDGLTCRFDQLLAVDQISLEVKPGEIFGLLGPNGAGKTTTIKLLTTLIKPTNGYASVGGYDVVENARAVRQRIAYVPQMISADGALTGVENLELSAKLYRIPRQERGARIAEAIAFMRLDGAANKLVKTYSGGMVRRLEIAQALLHRPEVLFLDEPTIGLDPVARHAVWEKLLQFRQNKGITIVLSTHDMEEADHLCDRIALLHRGKISVMGTPAALKAQVGPNATLNEVFVHFTGGSLVEAGTYSDVQKTRQTASRLS